MPSVRLCRLLPQAELLTLVATKGLEATALETGVSIDQLHAVYNEGALPNRGSVNEFKEIIGALLRTELTLRETEFELKDWFNLAAEVHTYTAGQDANIVANSRTTLAGTEGGKPVVKWASGYTPFDLLLSTDGVGFYHSLVTVVGKSGHGKTKHKLALAEGMRATNAVDSFWFFETEINEDMMLYQLGPARRRTQFSEKDELFCGMRSTTEILAMIREDPNPNRAIFIDSPDVMVGGIGEGRRFSLEAIYRDLILIKEQSKIVVVASQARRGEKQLSVESVAEAWAKVWYSDIVITIEKLKKRDGPMNSVRGFVGKNRFGESEREIVFDFNYADMSWNCDSAVRQAVEDDEDAWG